MRSASLQMSSLKGLRGKELLNHLWSLSLCNVDEVVPYAVDKVSCIELRKKTLGLILSS